MINYSDLIKGSIFRITEGATNEEIKQIEQELNLKLSDDLVKFLLLSNGMKDEFKCDFIWNTERIISDNISFRSNDDLKELYMDFNCLLFFGDAGNGDQFAYRVNNGITLSDDIFVWNHEDDSRTWMTSNLEWFIKGWINKEISI